MKLLTGKKAENLGRVEFKIIFVTIYYVIFGALGMVAPTHVGERTPDSMQNFMLCISQGNTDCVLDRGVQNLLTAVTVLWCLWPLVILIFSLNPKSLKEKFTSCNNKTRPSTRQTNDSKPSPKHTHN